MQGPTYNSHLKELGYLTDLDKREVTKCINIDSRFRDNYYKTTASNFNFELPLQLKGVTQMKVTHFQLPNSWYSISHKLGNHFFWVYAKDYRKKFRFEIPDGKYDCYLLNSILCNLESTNDPDNKIKLVDLLLINLLTNKNGTGNFKTQVINISGLVNKYALDESNCTTPDYSGPDQSTLLGADNPVRTPITLLFNLDYDGNHDITSLPLKFGWMLGFRFGEYHLDQFKEKNVDVNVSLQFYKICRYIQSMHNDFDVEVGDDTKYKKDCNDCLKLIDFKTYPDDKKDKQLRFAFQDIINFLVINESYINDNFSVLVSEAFIDIYGPRYIFLAIDDFNHNVITEFNSCLNSSIINKKIMLKYSCFDPLDSSQYNDLLYNTNFVPFVREYANDVEIRRLNFQIVDEYGRELDLNNMDVSFVLEFKTLFAR